MTDPFRNLKWCENHAIWHEQSTGCLKCKENLPNYLRSRSEVFVGSKRCEELKKLIK